MEAEILKRQESIIKNLQTTVHKHVVNIAQLEKTLKKFNEMHTEGILPSFLSIDLNAAPLPKGHLAEEKLMLEKMTSNFFF